MQITTTTMGLDGLHSKQVCRLSFCHHTTSTTTTLTPPSPQVPRLTAVLRGLAHDPTSSFDPDAAFIERQKALAARQQQQQQQQSSGSNAAGGQQRSRLAQQLLGDWSKGECVCRLARVLWCLPVD